MDRHETRQNAFKQISAAQQVLTSMPTADTSKKTFKEHILGTPESKFEKAKKKFLFKLSKVTACCSDFTYKVDFNIPSDVSPVHYVVKAKEALTSLSCTETDSIILSFIAEAIMAADVLLEQPITQINNEAEMSK